MRKQRIFTSIRGLYQRLMFQPPVWAVILNPFFISRRSLFHKIGELQQNLSGRMLDFGCGRMPYKNLFTNVVNYVGVDIAVSGHNHASTAADAYYDGKTLPFPSDSFDSVFSSEVFEHVFNLSEILTELHRVLKPGGLMLATVPFFWAEHEEPFDCARYTSFGARYILEREGFEVVENLRTGCYLSAVFQMLANYALVSILPKNKYVKAALVPVLVAPISVVGIILASLLPKSPTLFLSNVMLVRKSEQKPSVGL